MKSSGSGSKMSMKAANDEQIRVGLGDDEAALFDYYKTPAAAGGGGGGPFTCAQRKELERQAMIYKCMISCVPVPPHLLFPLHPNLVYGGGRYSRKGDPEPGRCKRTDGKKWRCSREVAPQQKYCERHLHRGRPRSRKHVEPANISTTPYYKETQTLEEAASSKSKQQWDYHPLHNLLSYPELGLDLSNGGVVECPPLDLSMALGYNCDQCFFAQGGPLGEALHLASTPPSPSHATLSNTPTLDCLHFA